ncbi:LolA family protein [Yersinia pekkanenii]|uniref:DUF1571 domain-containing protein n=1 Tax=Yersinia pekkanenii TaxID=1288385 RepID=A0A0T9NZT6_9GAMM|nr:DUF1571 domain-containing protein [Yersinia pekkanenii]CNH38364.1 Uncharacterised protein [Yersinia pekkanenii]CRY65160.1 Uncharacterised protein [Yersinia pekkanenii]
MIIAPMLGASAIDPINKAQRHFEQIESYQVRVRSESALGDSTVIHYSYRKPGYVRMDFTEPHNGAVLVYDPGGGNVRLWPFGVNTLPVLSLLPTNTLIRDKNGHRVDQADIGTLLHNIHRLQQGGKTVILGEDVLAQQPVLHLAITGPVGVTVDKVHRYELWLESSHNFPVKVVSYGADEQRLETVVMDAMVLNLHFPEHFFTP